MASPKPSEKTNIRKSIGPSFSFAVEAVAVVTAEMEAETEAANAKAAEAKAEAKAKAAAEEAETRSKKAANAMPLLKPADDDDTIMEVVRAAPRQSVDEGRRISIADDWSREEMAKLKAGAKQGLRDQWARMNPDKPVPEKVRIDRLSGEELQEMWEGIAVLVGGGRDWGECKTRYAMLKRAKKDRARQRSQEKEALAAGGSPRRGSNRKVELGRRRSSKQNNQLPKRRSSRQGISLPNRKSSRQTIMGVMDSAGEAAELAEAQKLRAISLHHETELQSELHIKRSLHVEKTKKRLHRRRYVLYWSLYTPYSYCTNPYIHHTHTVLATLRSSIAMGLMNGSTALGAQAVGNAIKDAVKRAEEEEDTDEVVPT
jgi:hypothetical protein